MAKFDPQELDGTIYKLCDYHPYRLPDGSRNPAVDRNSRFIMDLKDTGSRNYNSAVAEFVERVTNAIDSMTDPGQRLQIAIVPSSGKGARSQAIEDIINRLNCAAEIEYNPDFLIRTKTIQKLHEGGRREIGVHLDSIIVGELPDPNIPILLLDDVTTTGNSMMACEQLLKEAGAGIVVMLAMGKTRR